MEYNKFKTRYEVLSEIGVAGLVEFVELFKKHKNYWEATKELHINMFSDKKNKEKIRSFVR